ncbi:hypothetical protein COLSTE_00900 [Collinsella stercoris DSM 13279]|uniref:Uncharacterized protein n=1 Tax=Collinsella stercoris DSM 13279 TaxID=445975 RepID=B6GA09_9ACTN|nr:hypothetical protein COLSTE_00900 [Collinsella stercoris DSM 13279]
MRGRCKPLLPLRQGGSGAARGLLLSWAASRRARAAWNAEWACGLSAL